MSLIFVSFHIQHFPSLSIIYLGRIRGTEHLKQNLPHFGNGGGEELEDFIELCEREPNGDTNNEGRIRRRLTRLSTRRDN